MKEEINILLEKYYEGVITLEEMRTLKRFFQNNDVHESIAELKTIFEFIEEEKSLTLDDSFDAKLFEAIEIDDIQSTLEDFYDGNSTLEQEQKLQSYFMSNQVVDQFINFKPHFQWLAIEKLQTTSPYLETKILQEIASPKPALIVVTPKSRLVQWAAAAALFIGLSLWGVNYTFQKKSSQTSTIASYETKFNDAETLDWSKYAVTNSNEINNQTAEALKILALAFNSSAKHASDGLKQGVSNATRAFSN